MINPTNKDIGRAVVYRPRHGMPEDGVITAFNDTYVFVRYGEQSLAKSTMRQDLHWLCGTDNDAKSIDSKGIVLNSRNEYVLKVTERIGASLEGIDLATCYAALRIVTLSVQKLLKDAGIEVKSEDFKTVNKE